MKTSRTRLAVVIAVASGVWACGRVKDSTDSSTGAQGPGTAGDEGTGAGAGGGGGGAVGMTDGEAPGSGGVTSSDGGAGGVGGVSGVAAAGGLTETGGAPAGSEVPPDLMTQPTVWIGEVESPVTYPTVLIDNTSPERVILILDAVTASVTGTLTFGEGPLPSPEPNDVYPTWSNSDGTFSTQSENWTYSPFPGLPYSILSSELIDDRLSINFAPAEVWDALCETQAAGSDDRCECDETGCRAILEPLRRLDLVVHGDTMEGQMTRPPGNSLDGVPAIRLERIQ